MTLEKYVPGEEQGAAFAAISDMMRDFDIGQSYADMMRYRIAGHAAAQCSDTYYVAHENGAARSRLWMGWGRHPGAIGNWGNFYTDPRFRGRGIGRALLDFWFAHLRATKALPRCFLCTTGSREITALYGEYGFRTALPGREYGPLYLPIGDSPDTFAAFCEDYYRPSPLLYRRPATIGYRHEIDCLLRFAYTARGLAFGIGEMGWMDAALLYAPERTEMLFTPQGHCVGWGFDGQLQLHPLYRNAEIIKDKEMI